MRILHSHFSGVSGNSRMRLPVALKTAFAIAAPTLLFPVSPMPRGACSSGVSLQMISMLGMFKLTGA